MLIKMIPEIGHYALIVALLMACVQAVLPLAGWTLAYFRNNTWTQPVSAAALGLNTPLPDGVRLVLDLPPGAGLIGQVSRDWVRPTFSVQRGS